MVNKDHVLSSVTSGVSGRTSSPWQLPALLHVLPMLCPCWTKAVNPVSSPNPTVKHPLCIVTMTLMLARALASSCPTLGVLDRGRERRVSHRPFPASGKLTGRPRWQDVTDRRSDGFGEMGNMKERRKRRGAAKIKAERETESRQHGVKKERDERPRGRKRELVERETKWSRKGKRERNRDSQTGRGVICHLAAVEVWWLCFCQAQRRYNGLLDTWSLWLSRLLL